MALNPRGIHHVNVTVGEMVAARSFYIDVLGLTERTDRPNFRFDGAWLDIGGQQVHLVVGPPQPKTSDHFAILVDDIDDAVASLRSLGITVSDPQPVATSRQCFLHDPWGNFVELQQLNAV